jgi:hypothetical protein
LPRRLRLLATTGARFARRRSLAVMTEIQNAVIANEVKQSSVHVSVLPRRLRLLIELLIKLLAI